MNNRRRILTRDADAPRFRLVRLWRVGGKIKAEILGSAETPSEAIDRVFAEPGCVVAVDRRGDAYCKNANEIETREP